ncbi:MAG TPA: hypothetical protein VFP58_13100 [Candidatus Eisenbacteria bacterium]|nr:hypothetical protein [Candidatus Eisenbacteria bacterium]
MRLWIALAVAMAILASAGTVRANGGLSFVAGRYYFDLSYGKVSLGPNQTAPAYEFYRETPLHGSTIWKIHFRSILRIEFPSESAAFDSVASRAEKATVAWNHSRTHILASFGEYAFILTPEFHLAGAYRNTESAKWLNNNEIQAIVETGVPRKYDTGVFAIDVNTDRFRRIH